jgi:hypothetical protein
MRGLSTSTEFAEAPPHPNPLPLKGERERQLRAHLTSAPAFIVLADDVALRRNASSRA